MPAPAMESTVFGPQASVVSVVALWSRSTIGGKATSSRGFVCRTTSLARSWRSLLSGLRFR
jgi:hypothetical protein